MPDNISLNLRVTLTNQVQLRTQLAAGATVWQASTAVPLLLTSAVAALSRKVATSTVSVNKPDAERKRFWGANLSNVPNLHQNKAASKSTLRKLLMRINLVGASGFEPEASCAQGRRATRLRYAPT
jgi:hypothetical protein